MRRQQQIAQARVRSTNERQQGNDHRQQPDGTQADCERRFEQRRAGAERRDQNHLRGRGPYQHGRQCQATMMKSQNHEPARQCRYTCRPSPEKIPSRVPNLSRRKTRLAGWKMMRAQTWTPQHLSHRPGTSATAWPSHATLCKTRRPGEQPGLAVRSIEVRPWPAAPSAPSRVLPWAAAKSAASASAARPEASPVSA